MHEEQSFCAVLLLTVLLQLLDGESAVCCAVQRALPEGQEPVRGGQWPDAGAGADQLRAGRPVRGLQLHRRVLHGGHPYQCLLRGLGLQVGAWGSGGGGGGGRGVGESGRGIGGSGRGGGHQHLHSSRTVPAGFHSAVVIFMAGQTPLLK